MIPFKELEAIPLPETQNTISLQEALTRKPQTFKMRPQNHDQRPTSPSQEPHKNEFFNSSDSHKLRPGQVARLN